MRDIGKIDRNKISELFYNRLGRPASEIIQGSAFGVDTGVIQIDPKKSLVVASDPASFIPSLGVKESAWLTVILTANDIATSGCLPSYAQFVLNLTHKMTEEELTSYWGYIHQFCLDMGIAITGGHTGFDHLGSSTLAGGTTMFAMVDNEKIKCASFASTGQDLILTKSAALSSSAILAKSFPLYTQKHLGTEVCRYLEDSFYQTGIMQEIKILNENPNNFQKITALHDVTEGGVLGAIYELCEASRVGVRVDAKNIHVGKAQQQICNLFDINPLRSTGAGSLLIACEEEASSSILSALHQGNISATIVGKTLAEDEGKRILHSEGENRLEYEEKDPYWEAFFDAIDRKLN